MFSLMFKSGRSLDLEQLLASGDTTEQEQEQEAEQELGQGQEQELEQELENTRRISVPEPAAEDILLTRVLGPALARQSGLDPEPDSGLPFTNILQLGGRPLAASPPSPFSNVLLEAPPPAPPPPRPVVAEGARSLEERVRAAMASVLGLASVPRAPVLEQPPLGGAVLASPAQPSLGGAVVDPPPAEDTALGGPVLTQLPASALPPPEPSPPLTPPPPPAPSPPPPRVRIVELAGAEPGCRSFSTTTCTR